jgi:hypothetical protein
MAGLSLTIEVVLHDVAVGAGTGIVPEIRSTLGVDECVTPESHRRSESERDDDREQHRQPVLPSDRAVVMIVSIGLSAI